MTNEEAIKRLKSDIYKYSDFTENPNENEFWTAFDMAIKALEQEPCEDAISRQAAIEAMNGWEWQELYLPIHFKQLLESLPPVKPTRAKGKWIEHEHEAGLNWEFSKYECNLCHALVEDDSYFCPNCGADMRGEE